MKYNLLEGEWYGVCGACKTEIYAPTKGAWRVSFSIHTHSDNCLGGY